MPFCRRFSSTCAVITLLRTRACTYASCPHRTHARHCRSRAQRAQGARRARRATAHAHLSSDNAITAISQYKASTPSCRKTTAQEGKRAKADPQRDKTDDAPVRTAFPRNAEAMLKRARSRIAHKQPPPIRQANQPLPAHLPQVPPAPPQAMPGTAAAPTRWAQNPAARLSPADAPNRTHDKNARLP